MESFESCAGLMVLCAVLSAAVWYFARDLDLYPNDDDVDGSVLELKELNSKRDPKITTRRATPGARRRKHGPMASEGGDMTVTSDQDMEGEPEEMQLTFNILELSDHLEDSMEEHTRNRPLSVY